MRRHWWKSEKKRNFWSNVFLEEDIGALVAEYYQVSWRQKWSFSSSSHSDGQTWIVSFWLEKKPNLFIHLLSYSEKSGEKHASAITWYQHDLSQKYCLLRKRNRNFLASQESFAHLPGVPGPDSWHLTNFQPKTCHYTYCELSCLLARCPVWGRIKGLRI